MTSYAGPDGISKTGNAMARDLLHEAASSILARLERSCALRS
jgi:hypothetical protein